MGKTIYIVGPMAAGKTTNAGLLTWFLTKYYDRCVIMQRRDISNRNLFVNVLARFLMRMGHIEHEFEDNSPYRVDSVYLSRIYDLWILLESMGFLMAYLLKVLPFQIIGCDVILTRFVIDFLTEMYSISKRTNKGLRIPSILTYVLLRPLFRIDAMIYLDADYPRLYERMHKRRSTLIPPPQRLAFERIVTRRLFWIANKYYDDGLYINTTNKDLTTVFIEIIKHLRLSWP